MAMAKVLPSPNRAAAVTASSATRMTELLMIILASRVLLVRICIAVRFSPCRRVETAASGLAVSEIAASKSWLWAFTVKAPLVRSGGVKESA